MTKHDRLAEHWWRRGPRWIVARVTTIGRSHLGWGGVAFEQAVAPLHDADLAAIVTAARQCMTKRTS